MKALVYTDAQSAELRDVAAPVPAEGEALIRVEAVGICGSDMHAWAGHDTRRPTPLILGHEAAGIVISGQNPGTRVTVNPLVTCMSCDYCKRGRTNICPRRQIISMPPREGAFAQQLAIPERNLVEIPDHVPIEHAALTEPIACSWHAVRLARQALDWPIVGVRAVVIGGGAVGLAAALVLADAGCTDIWVAETNPLRHPALNDAGPFKVYDPQSSAGPDAASAHVVIDAFGGSASRSAAVALAKPGAVISHIGLASGEGGFDARRVTLQEITFIGTYTYTMADFVETAGAIFAGRLGKLDWFDSRPLRDGPAAFEGIANGAESAPKIILRPHD